MRKTIIMMLLAIFLLSIFSINAAVKETGSNPASSEKSEKPGDSKELITLIKDNDQLRKIIEASGETLLVIDFYADWCGPCRRLSPMLHDIASSTKRNVKFFKVDVDKSQDLAGRFKITGIPHVVFIRNEEIVQTLTGLYPEEAYRNMIKEYSSSK